MNEFYHLIRKIYFLICSERKIIFLAGNKCCTFECFFKFLIAECLFNRVFRIVDTKDNFLLMLMRC